MVLKGFPPKCPRCMKSNFTSYYKRSEKNGKKERWFKCNNCRYETLMI